MYIQLNNNKKGLKHMTDFSKYKNVTVTKDTYAKIDKIRKLIVPDDPNTSRSKTVTLLVNREMKKLNGKERKNHDKSST